jgi:hypothetical protein
MVRVCSSALGLKEEGLVIGTPHTPLGLQWAVAFVKSVMKPNIMRMIAGFMCHVYHTRRDFSLHGRGKG